MEVMPGAGQNLRDSATFRGPTRPRCTRLSHCTPGFAAPAAPKRVGLRAVGGEQQSRVLVLVTALSVKRHAEGAQSAHHEYLSGLQCFWQLHRMAGSPTAAKVSAL